MVAGITANTNAWQAVTEANKNRATHAAKQAALQSKSRLISAHVTLLPSACGSVMSRQASQVSSVLMFYNQCFLKLTTCSAGGSEI